MRDLAQRIAARKAEGRPRREWFTITPRSAFGLLAVVLTAILIALLVYLVWFFGRPQVLNQLPPVQGIQPIWQVYGPGEGELPFFDRPMGVAVGAGSRVYVTDTGNNRICVFDSQGRYLSSFGSFGVAKSLTGAGPTYAPGSLNYPVGIDTDSDGNVYVASFRNDSIEVFDADGRPLRRFPDPYRPTGEGSSGLGGLGIAVTGVAVHKDRLYATDRYQIIVFNLEGEVLDQWGMPGDDPGDLDHPNGIAVSNDGKTIYVADSNHSRVSAFTPEGDLIWQVGEIPEGISDRSDTPLQLPRGLTVMPDNSILVSDAFAFTLVRISAEGEVVAEYGERGVDPGQVNFANDVETFRGLVVIADKENGRVQTVRLLN
ncbi:MAG: NHL repeat-containing protein [Coriobacteriia bacterium]